MRLNPDQVISALATIAPIKMMGTIGLAVTLYDAICVARDGSLIGRATFANYVVVPAVMLALVLLFRASPMVAIGFLIAAVCPGAPCGPPFAALAGANVGRAVRWMVLLAGSSAIAAPLLLKCLLPMVAGNGPIQFDAANARRERGCTAGGRRAGLSRRLCGA